MSNENAKRVAKKLAVLKELHKGRKLIFLRFRVEIPVSNPLPVGFFQPRGNGEELWVQLKFENAPMFCYSCGSIGHDQKSCTVPCQIIISPAGRKVWKFGPWLKAEAGKDSCFQVDSFIPESLVKQPRLSRIATFLSQERQIQERTLAWIKRPRLSQARSNR